MGEGRNGHLVEYWAEMPTSGFADHRLSMYYSPMVQMTLLCAGWVRFCKKAQFLAINLHFWPPRTPGSKFLHGESTNMDSHKGIPFITSKRGKQVANIFWRSKYRIKVTLLGIDKPIIILTDGFHYMEVHLGNPKTVILMDYQII